MAIDLSSVGKELPEFKFSYDWKNCIIYALAIGADEEDVDFIYEGSPNFKVYPTFAVVPTYDICLKAVSVTKVNPMKMMHAGQRTVLHNPIPRKATVITKNRIRNILDKEKFAIIVIEANSFLEDGTKLFDNIFSLLVFGEGGFGGQKADEKDITPVSPDNKEPDFVLEKQTLPVQALMYRISGSKTDYNPLHADPGIAKLSGFDRPILHGLASYGILGRTAFNTLCNKNLKRFKSITGKFIKPVFPGNTLTIKGYKIGANSYSITGQTTPDNINLLVNVELNEDGTL